MIRFVLVALILLNPLLGWAHSPLLSTAAITKNKNNTWSVHISASLSALQLELKNRYPTIQVDSLTADEFQRLVLRHLRETVTIEDSKKGAIELKNGLIKLGHQTDIRFDITGISGQPRELRVQHLGFFTLRNHYCVFTIVTPETGRTNFILQQDNRFTVDLAFKGHSITEIHPAKPIGSWSLALLSLACLLFLIAIGYSRQIQLA